MRTESYFENILHGAMDLMKKDSQQDQKTLFDLLSKGVACSEGRCDYCKSTINNKWDKQEIWLLTCDHIYHARCIAKTACEKLYSLKRERYRPAA